MSTYGICHLSILPVRAAAFHTSELVNQLLFGEVYEIKQQDKEWVEIVSTHDWYTGWINHKQLWPLSSADFDAYQRYPHPLAKQLVQAVKYKGGITQAVLGSTLPFFEKGRLKIGERPHTFDQFVHAIPTQTVNPQAIRTQAYQYLNAPYLWGGRSPFGIDCSALVQMVYKFFGINLPRDASQQAEIGTLVSSREVAKVGDLAFFNNEAGKITHVGILCSNQEIIHASGRVKIDWLDDEGIYDLEKEKHSHQLHSIRNVLENKIT